MNDLLVPAENPKQEIISSIVLFLGWFTRNSLLLPLGWLIKLLILSVPIETRNTMYRGSRVLYPEGGSKIRPWILRRCFARYQSLQNVSRARLGGPGFLAVKGSGFQAYGLEPVGIFAHVDIPGFLEPNGDRSHDSISLTKYKKMGRFAVLEAKLRGTQPSIRAIWITGSLEGKPFELSEPTTFNQQTDLFPGNEVPRFLFFEKRITRLLGICILIVGIFAVLKLPLEIFSNIVSLFPNPKSER